MQNIKIALCQIVILDGDRDGNLIRIENAVAEAKDKHADIACFPEMCIYGWVNPEAHHLASTIPGKNSDRLCAIAEQFQMHISIGLAEKDGDDLYDSAILIDNQGKIVLKHRKINLLSELMNPPYTPGKTVQVIVTQFGRIGILICADTFEEHLLLEIKDQCPDLLLVPYGWAEEANKFPEHGQKLADVVSHAAAVIGAPVIGTDSVGMILHGPWKGRVYGGQSVAADAMGNILIRLKDRDKDLQIIKFQINHLY